ncbi:TRAFs-binding domain-containing protein [Skermanella mucosa]|uniref:serine protease n=1 Tax=Skermanella mucosa TaxID=1789672 RepID=UPI00192AC5B0|nr:serine protease [Skermanella mucosa]UEM19105.1 TRAFs-binding domain-containing protein [Skermanella mucosa]
MTPTTTGLPKPPDLPEMVDDVLDAARNLDTARLDEATEILVAHLRRQSDPPDTPLVKRVLGELRRWRHFGALQRFADAMIRMGCDSHLIYRQYAQALINRGELIPALDLLKRLEERARDDRDEYPETCGLLGRTYKQIFVEARGSRLGMGESALGQSVAWYNKIYEADAERVWHGVNVVALLCRAERDGIRIPFAPDAAQLAARIRDHIGRRWTEVLPAWDYATAAEACIALEDWSGAERWLGKYLAAQDVDAFAIAGTLRQLTEVWDLRIGGGPGGDLLPVLQAELLRRENGRISLAPGQVKGMQAADSSTFERVLGNTGLTTYRWMCMGIERARAVARIQSHDGNRNGTGFLLRGGDLHESFGDEMFLLTNSHVVTDDPMDTEASSIDEAEISFEALAEPGFTAPRYSATEVVWSSPPGDLDAILLRLDETPGGVKPCPISRTLPFLEEGQRVYIIGHPSGRDLSFSIQDNRLLDHEGPPDGRPSRPGRCLLHYRAPTERGSSGSPVFSAQAWRVVGLHRAGFEETSMLNGKRDTYAANEGVWIQSIRDDVVRSVEAGTVRR